MPTRDEGPRIFFLRQVPVHRRRQPCRHLYGDPRQRRRDGANAEFVVRNALSREDRRDSPAVTVHARQRCAVSLYFQSQHSHGGSGPAVQATAGFALLHECQHPLTRRNRVVRIDLRRRPSEWEDASSAPQMGFDLVYRQLPKGHRRNGGDRFQERQPRDHKTVSLRIRKPRRGAGAGHLCRFNAETGRQVGLAGDGRQTRGACYDDEDPLYGVLAQGNSPS